jgi:hypothetical protein
MEEFKAKPQETPAKFLRESAGDRSFVVILSEAKLKRSGRSPRGQVFHP